MSAVEQGSTRRDPAPSPAGASTAAATQFAVGLIFALSFLFFSVWARLRVPYRDDWDWLLTFLTEPFSPATWFTPHNEHVIVLARLLFASQFAIEGAAGHVIFVVALLAQATPAWLLWREARRRWPGDGSLFVGGLTAVLLLSTFQLQSVVFGAAILFPLVQMWALLAFVAALNATEPGAARVAWLTTAAGCAAAAALTTTNGLVVPLVVGGVLWRRRERRLVAAGFALATVIALGLYVVFVAGPATGPGDGPGIVAMAAFFFAFFGTALAYASVPVAIAVGAVVFALCSIAVVAAAYERDRVPRLELFAVAMICSRPSARPWPPRAAPALARCRRRSPAMPRSAWPAGVR